MIVHDEPRETDLRGPNQTYSSSLDLVQYWHCALDSSQCSVAEINRCSSCFEVVYTDHCYFVLIVSSC